MSDKYNIDIDPSKWFFIWVILISGEPDLIDGIVTFLQNIKIIIGQ